MARKDNAYQHVQSVSVDPTSKTGIRSVSRSGWMLKADITHLKMNINHSSCILVEFHSSHVQPKPQKIIEGHRYRYLDQIPGAFSTQLPLFWKYLLKFLAVSVSLNSNFQLLYSVSPPDSVWIFLGGCPQSENCDQPEILSDTRVYQSFSQDKSFTVTVQCMKTVASYTFPAF